jgi:hypothetical protein
MPAKLFRDCDYSVFFSYAHEDNDYWDAWITDFRNELRKSQASNVSGVPVPPIHLSQGNGPINGSLDERLYRAIEGSFAMVIFVADHYLASKWCLKELEYFKECFGDEGFRDRLFIVAMSKPAVDELKRHDAWRAICGEEDLAHLEFHRKSREVWHRPLIMFVADPERPDRKIFPTTEFWERFLSFREKLREQMREAVLREERGRGYPSSQSTAPADDVVRVYIEADRRLDRYWESLQRKVVEKWDEVVAEEGVEPPLHLRPERLNAADVSRSPELQLANGVILLWASKSATSVAAQIDAIEPHLPGASIAPGVIIYLGSGPDDRPPQDEIKRWKVIGLRARETDGSTTVLGSYAERLREYMKYVLEHKRASGGGA